MKEEFSVHMCDRCGKMITKQTEQYNIFKQILKRKNNEWIVIEKQYISEYGFCYGKNRFDLCKDCSKAFCEWMNTGV